MTTAQFRCLILACGNTLRGDDGIGPWLADWAEEKFRKDLAIRLICRQQWTPDLAEDIAAAESVLFLDCSIASAPGEVNVVEVAPAAPALGLATHHIGAPELLALTQELYGVQPAHALLLTVGAGSTELSEAFSPAVNAAIPEACSQLEDAVQRLLNPGSS